MSAAYVQIAATQVTPGSAGSYVDIDCSGSLPDEAIAVEIEYYESASYAADIWLRVNGSTDNIYQATGSARLGTWFVGVDANGVFEMKSEYTTRPVFYVRGYFTSPYQFRTNQLDVSTGTTDSFVDTDVSASCPGATVVLLNFIGYPDGAFLRKNGSTDDRFDRSTLQSNTSPGHFVGVDASIIFEQEIGNAGCDLYVVAYHASGSVVMNTNGTDRSLANTGSFYDLTALPSGALYGFYAVHNKATSERATFLRPNGSRETLYNTDTGSVHDDGCCYFIVGCDANRVVEQRIENTTVDTYEMGYGIDENTAPAAPTELLCEGSTNPTGVTDTTPEFSAVYNDDDEADVATHFEVEVNTAEAFNGTSMWDSGWIDIADCDEGNRGADVSYAGTSLSENGFKYYWRCRYKDTAGAEGAWSAVANFTMKPKGVSVTDSGSGAETPAIEAALPTISDTGGGAEAPTVAAQVPVTDAGAGDDVPSVPYESHPVSDAGEGVDAPGIEAAVPVSDAGEGSEDGGAVTASIPVSDDGAAAETPSLEAAVPVADTGEGSDEAEVPWQTRDVADSGESNEVPLPSALVPVDDSGAGAEGAGAITATIPVGDIGGGDEAHSVGAAVPVEDSGAGAEEPGIVSNVAVEGDVGSGTETAAVVASFTIEEAGSGGEDLHWKRMVAVDDTGTILDELISVIAMLLLSDTGSGEDSPSIKASVSVSDVGGNEVTNLSVTAWLETQDAGTATESQSIVAQIELDDAGSGEEQLLGISNFVVVPDLGAGDDASTILVAVPLTDAGLGADAPTIRVTLPALEDIGVGVDTHAILVRLTLTDAASGDEALAISFRFQLLDSATGADSVADVLARIPLEDAGVGFDLAGRLIPIDLTEDGTAIDVLEAIRAWIGLSDSGAGTESELSAGESIPSVGITLLKYPPKDAVIEFDKDADVLYDLDA